MPRISVSEHIKMALKGKFVLRGGFTPQQEEFLGEVVEMFRATFPIPKDESSESLILTCDHAVLLKQMLEICKNVLQKSRPTAANAVKIGTMFATHMEKFMESSIGPIRTIPEQLAMLQEDFPSLSLEKTRVFVDQVFPSLQLPEGALGWFAVPHYRSLGHPLEGTIRMLGAMGNRRGVYYDEREMLAMLARGFHNCHTWDFWNKIRQAQGGGDVLIIAAQMGNLHRDRSVKKVRDSFAQNEFGLDALAIATILVTNPHLEEFLHTLRLAPILSIACTGHEDETGFIPEFRSYQPRDTMFMDCGFHAEAPTCNPATGWFVQA